MDKAKGMKIQIRRDGPYEVSGNVPLRQAIIKSDPDGMAVAWESGQSYQPDEEPYKLCRCGHSRNKPYCDGTHEDTCFCGHEHADRPPYESSAELIEGPTINLLDDESLCAGARFCDLGETIWGYVEKSDDPQCRQHAIEEACNCPSGRLTIVEHDGTAHEPVLKPAIGLQEDPAANCRGPLLVTGGIEIVGCNDEAFEIRNRVALCRCGESNNQPFCDSTHLNCPHMQGLD